MEYIFEEGDIVIYKKDNSFYKIIEVQKTDKVKSTSEQVSYIITDDVKIIPFVQAKDLERP